MLLKVNLRQRDTLLAALRLWEQHNITPNHELAEIAEENGPMLSDEEINELCEGINGGDLVVEVLGQAAPELAIHHNTDPYAEAFIEAARRKADDYLEIDDVALISASEGGSWVNAWVWVSNDEAGVHSEEEQTDA